MPITSSDIVLKNPQGTSITYTDISSILAPDPEGTLVEYNLGGGSGTYQEKTGVVPSTQSQTITPDEGYDALSSVQINAMPEGTAGTPIATKGIVSNYSVQVTPRVTNETGYITGSTKTGTAVTVSASELVSGTETITAGTSAIVETDVTNKKYVTVNPTPSETKTATPSTSSQTISPTSGKLLSSVTVEAIPSQYKDTTGTDVVAADILSGKKAVNTTGQVTGTMANNGATGATITTQGGTYNIPAGYTTGGTVTATLPTTTLDNTIISGQAYEEATGDYAWRSTVTIPTGYHTSQTLTKDFSEIFPAPETPATASEMLLGYQAFNKSGVLMTGTMANNGATTGTISTQGGTFTIPAGYHNGEGVITATLPSGSAGTPIVEVQRVAESASVMATPSVTSSTGYITGETKTGVPVMISASDLVSGNKALSSGTSAQNNIDVTNYATVSISAIATAEHANPTANINTSTGVVTASHTQTAGYVSAGTTTGTLSLSTQGTATITPSTSVQTAVAAGKYTTGAVTVAAVPTETKTATANGTVTPTSGKFLSSVTVAIETYDGSLKEIEYLTFTPSEGTVSVTPSEYWNATTKEYSIDGGTTWLTWTSGTITGNSIKLRGLGGTSGSRGSYWHITGTEVACSGNIETILDYSIVEGGGHPTMDEYCYPFMFEGCTSLTTAPELPATTLATECYKSMFEGCTSLTTAPELPATTLADYCYESMFQGCTSLTTATELPATTLATECYKSMFQDCTSLTTAPELPATTLAYGCYSSMFSWCTSLTTAPELPVTTLATGCYADMFEGCTSLTTAPELPATTMADYCYSYMFYGCTSLTTAPELPATTLADYCYRRMFEDCTSLTTAPELPATTLADSCYYGMFKQCTSLYVSDISGTGFDKVWRIPTEGTFTNTYSQSGMFANCLGTRSSDDMAGAAGQSYTYYTQNTPV